MTKTRASLNLDRIRRLGLTPDLPGLWTVGKPGGGAGAGEVDWLRLRWRQNGRGGIPARWFLRALGGD